MSVRDPQSAERNSDDGRSSARRAKRGQRGYLMAGLMAAVAVMVIFSTLAFQAWIDVLQRDNEAEMMFRAQDLVRAIQRYRRANAGVGPQKLEDLMKPGPRGEYYLRRLWTDPLVKKGKWGLLYIGPGGQIVDPNAEGQPGGLPGAPGAGSGLGSPGSIFDRQPGAQPGQPGQAPGQQPGLGQTPSLQQQQQQQGGQQQQPQFRSLSSGEEGADPNAGGKQLSGLPIAGVKSLCEESPFRVHNGLSDYAEWRFTYLDLELPQLPRRGGQGGQRVQPGTQRQGRSPFTKGKGKGRGR